MTASPSRFGGYLSVTALAVLALITPVSAQITDGSFESNKIGSTTISGWSTTGSTVIASSSFGDSATDGARQVFLNNDPQASLGYKTVDAGTAAALENFLGLTSGALSNLGNGTAMTGSGIKQTFTLVQTEQISFDYDFVTSEDPSFPPPNPDFGFFSVTSGSGTDVIPLANVSDATLPEPPPAGRPSPSIDDYLSETGYKTYTYRTLLGPGTYTLGFGVVNADTDDVGSGLLVDNVILQPASAVPESSSSLSLALLLWLGGLFCFRRSLRLIPNLSPNPEA